MKSKERIIFVVFIFKDVFNLFNVVFSVKNAILVRVAVIVIFLVHYGFLLKALLTGVNIL